MDEFVRAPEFAITPHPDAPDFRDPDAGRRLLKDFISSIEGEHFVLTKDALDLMRQLGLVSLWFFLKFIAGATGPYDYLNQELHLDMCNFRQSRYCLEPGARAAMFVFRGTSKTTIGTHGGGFWEATRDPDQRLLIVNAKSERAHDFKNVIKVVAEKNPLYAALYGKHLPPNGPTGTPRWNETELVFWSRSKVWKEATFNAAGITGAKEGDHFTGVFWDDPLGLDALDSSENASLVMETAKKSFRTNSRALLISPKLGRDLVFATFYAPDDLFMTEIVAKCKAVFGYQDPDIQPVEGGMWNIYYRCVVEDGKATCPYVMTKEEYEQLLKEAPWTALMQYANKPRAARQGHGLSGRARPCFVKRDKDENWVIVNPGDRNFDEPGEVLRLEQCNVVMSIDPAGTDRKVSSHTARTSIGVWAMDSKERVYRIFSRVGYYSDEQMYEYIFEGHRLFPGYIHTTIFETNAMQGVLANNLEKEMLKRHLYFGVLRRPETGDKKARIRHTVGYYLGAGKVYLADGCGQEFIEEQYVFPGGPHTTLDVLDESQKAMSFLTRPATVAEEFEAEDEEEERAFEHSASLFGEW